MSEKAKLPRQPRPDAPERVPEEGHMTIACLIGIGVAFETRFVIYDDAVDLVLPGVAAPVLLSEHDLWRLEKVVRQARRAMPTPERVFEPPV